MQEENMCGRYHIDNEVVREIEKILEQRNGEGKREDLCWESFCPKEIYPTDKAPVLLGDGKKLCLQFLRWGFPIKIGSQNKGNRQVIFHARSETALEKPMFRESIFHNPVVIPARWFYEWNRNKEKSTFYRKEQAALFMAGCARLFGEEMRFVILTTNANSSIEVVHHRMPLILNKKEIFSWILDKRKNEEILNKTPDLLERKTDYEQMKFF